MIGEPELVHFAQINASGVFEKVPATGRDHGELPGLKSDRLREIEGKLTITTKPSSLSSSAVSEGVDVLLARTQEI